MTGELLTFQPQPMAPITPEATTKHELDQAMQVLTRSKLVIVQSAEDYAHADQAVGAIKSAQKRAEAIRTDLVKPLNDTVKKINAGFRPVDEAYTQALTCYRTPMSAYQAEQARQRAAAESEAKRLRDKAEAEARALAEIEEAAARMEREAAFAAMQSAPKDDPFAALLAEEESAEAQARADAHSLTAQDIIRTMRMAECPVAVPAKVTGSASKTFTTWKYEITDEALVPKEYWVIDHAAIARDLKAEKSEFKAPGIRTWSEQEVK